MTSNSVVSANLLATLTWLSLSFMIGSDRAILAQAKGKPARKFDEFGDIQYSDLIARLDKPIRTPNSFPPRRFLTR